MKKNYFGLYYERVIVENQAVILEINLKWY